MAQRFSAACGPGCDPGSWRPGIESHVGLPAGSLLLPLLESTKPKVCMSHDPVLLAPGDQPSQGCLVLAPRGTGKDIHHGMGPSGKAGRHPCLPAGEGDGIHLCWLSMTASHPFCLPQGNRAGPRTSLLGRGTMLSFVRGVK